MGLLLVIQLQKDFFRRWTWMSALKVAKIAALIFYFFPNELA